MGNGRYPIGGAAASVFDDSVLHDVELTMSPEDWQSILDDSRGDEWRRVTVRVDGATLSDAGVRPAGESSRIRGNLKMSMKVKFDAFKDQKLAGLNELKLDGGYADPSLLRQRLAYYVLGSRLPAPRQVHARLTVNGELRGVYGIEEVWENDAIKDRFPEPTGPLYRIRGLTTGEDPYVYRGTDMALYVPFPWDPQNQAAQADALAITKVTRVLSEDLNSLETVCDVENLLEYFAASALITNVDGFTGAFEVDDHFAYFDTRSGKLFVLPWDPDNTFGSTNDSPERSIYESFDKSILARVVRDTPALRARYKAKLDEIMRELSLSALSTRLDFIFGQIREAAYEDPYKMYPNDHFDFSLGYIKDFAAARYASVRRQIAEP